MAGKARILIVRWSWFCNEVAAVFQELGHEVTVVERSAPAVMIPQITAAIHTQRPEVLFSVNFNPLFAEIAHRERVARYAAWNVDNLAGSGFCAPDHRQPETVIFLIDRPSLEIYRRNGYAHLHYLPIATRLNRFIPDPAGEALRDEGKIVSFVGCSMIRQGNEFPALMRRLARQERESHTEADRMGYALVLNTLHELVERGCRDFFNVRMEEWIAACSEQLGFDLAKTVWPDPAFFYIAPSKEVSSRKRVALLRAAADVTPITVYGDADWASVTHPGLHYAGPADYRTQTPGIYRASAISLNIEKTYNTSSINLRMIDALAAGSLVLTEPVDDLPRYFHPGVDVVCFHSIPEMQDQLRYYLAHPGERRAIALAGQARVKEYFSLHKRLAEMMELLEM